MSKPKPTDLVHVIVTERPQRVWVVCNGVVHHAHWRTSESGDRLRHVEGNYGLLHAAMLVWCGQSHFTTTFDDVEFRSQGYGAWDEAITEPTHAEAS